MWGRLINEYYVTYGVRVDIFVFCGFYNILGIFFPGVIIFRGILY